MSRWRRFLANPYKTQTVYALLTKRIRLWRVSRQLKSLTPGNVSKVINISDNLFLYFKNRQHPVYFFDPEHIPHIIAAIPDSQKEATIRQAFRETICRTFSFRNSPAVTFPGKIDWCFTVASDPDWNRDLHRLDWIVVALLSSHYTGEKGYTVAAGEALAHWWQENPPGSAPWADPFEVAQRAHTLSWILFLSLQLPFCPEFVWETVLCAVLACGAWLAATLEYQTPNNHLLIEIIRLYGLGLLFPEYPNARQWRQLGEALLAQEIDRQVLPDGFHCELSVFYHRMVLEALLECIALARRNNLELPENIHRRTTNMLATLQLVRRPDGTYPLWGDGFQADSLLRHDLPAAGALLAGSSYAGGQPAARTLWLLNGIWPQPNPSPIPTAHFWPDAGYAVMSRSYPKGFHQLTFDCGPFGLAAAPGHGHADCLSVTLNFGHQPVLIDPGTYSFRDLHWRQAFRGTAAHNTIVINSQEQTPIPGFFGAGRFALPQVNTAILSNGLRFVDASHDGYTRLPQPVHHRRLLLDIPETGWLIIDLLTGQGENQTDLNWHFHPNIMIKASAGEFAGLVHGKKFFQMQCCASSDMVMQLSTGPNNPSLGWLSEEAGRKVATPVVRISGKIKPPSGIATLFLPTTGDLNSSLQLHRTEVGFAIEINCGINSTIVLVSLDKPAQLNMASWSITGKVFLCHQTPLNQDIVLAGGEAVSWNHVKILSLPRPSSGLLLSKRPDHFQLVGEVELPLEISSPRELPVVINDKPVKAFYDRHHQLLKVVP